MTKKVENLQIPMQAGLVAWVDDADNIVLSQDAGYDTQNITLSKREANKLVTWLLEAIK